jgi:hypothetical protein
MVISYSQFLLRPQLKLSSGHSMGQHNLPAADSVYVNVEEVVPNDSPMSLGYQVTTVAYIEINLYHDMLNGRLVSEVLHF